VLTDMGAGPDGGLHAAGRQPNGVGTGRAISIFGGVVKNADRGRMQDLVDVVRLYLK
jgi:hypothetical protein